ncbi:MAG TPA: MOSC domain-containing protein [Kiloniellales bacterium]|nr:MOSC domain-containing protein [Kiloniellales bacterium]
MSICLTAINRYPIKGLNQEPLQRVSLQASKRLPGDRIFALAHGSAPWQAATPQWLPPKHFYSLRNEPRLAQLEAHFDCESGRLTLHRQNREVVRANIREPLGRTIIGEFFANFLGPDGRGLPKLVEAAPSHPLTDVPDPWVSMINLDTLEDLARVARRKLDPRRFRANLWISGAGAWKERDWLGREIKIGRVRLKVVEMIERCAATNVDPDRAEPDMNLPLMLQRGYGHRCMGVYCKVMSDGEIKVGDQIGNPGP